MKDKNDSPVRRHQGDSSPVAQTMLEESHDWVIACYRKHRLGQVFKELNEVLGAGPRKKTWLPRELLDLNPAHHRQSLLEQVFPTPRVIHEDLMEVNRLKIRLEAGAGMGKTTFLKHYQESQLLDRQHPVYPLPVYFHLGSLPEGTGFEKFFESVLQEILQTVLLERQDLPELELNEEVILRTIGSIFRCGKILFLLDGLDEMELHDRFQTYLGIIVDDNSFRSNFVVMANRHLDFGPLATESIVQRGLDAGFQVNFQAIEEKERNRYLGEAQGNKALMDLSPHYPELFDTPSLLRMIRSLSEQGDLDELKGKGGIYQSHLGRLADDFATDGDRKEMDRLLEGLAEVSLNLMKESRAARYETVETGFEKIVLAGEENSLLVEGEKIPPLLKALLQETEKRWEYRHPSFQEYLAACSLQAKPDWKETVKTNCRDEKWEGVFIFLAGKVAVNELFDILFDEGALFLCGRALPEAEGLSEDRRLLIQHLLKYQCRESIPAFAPFRAVKISDVIAHCGKEKLKVKILPLLVREKRDSRVLYAVLELLLALYDMDLNEMVDRLDFEPLEKVAELQAFFNESSNPKQVKLSIVRRWGEWVTIPAGKFIYQDEKDEEDRVNMQEYSIMKYPVTNALYQQFDPNSRPLFSKYSDHPEQPVVGINFYESLVFSLWLNGRLPVEKEWEKASRGVDDRDYPWGEAMGYQNGFANTCDFLAGKTTPVMEFEQGISPYGCFDMAGNVWEWCIQPFASKHTTQKVVRGGSWLNYMVHSKCGFRNTFDPAERSLNVGLRCVKGPRFTEIEEDDDDD